MTPSFKQVATKTVDYVAFGQKINLSALDVEGEISRRLKQNQEIYTRALASRAIPQAGVCVDIGAGEGWFGLAFAKAFPQWKVVCLEPDEQTFALLEKNVAAQSLKNVTCLRAAVHPDVKQGVTKGKLTRNTDPYAALTKTQDADFIALSALAPRVAPADVDTPADRRVALPAVSLAALADLSPNIIKLDAPMCEEAIGLALKDAPIGLIMGPLYTYVPSGTFNPTEGPREFYLTHGDKALRRDFEDNFDGRVPGLDIVVAMYNATEFIVECVDSLLANGDENITVLVVDDGSTDGCGNLVEKHYAGQSRVRLLRKANGGCASARNYGREHSTASHIAFLDADDRVDEDMFTALFEVARYTGAPVTEGEFFMFSTNEDGTEDSTPSYEATMYSVPGDQQLGPYDFLWTPSNAICYGQPTIWRRVHRRDFLDHKKIWFPEHIRAFDDQIFQFLVGELAGSIAHIRGHSYHYRQHAAQDIKQGDERHFYSFNMFRSIVIRSLEESWKNTDPLIQSLFNTMSWSYSGLRPDLKPIYRQAAAKFLAVISKTYGNGFSEADLSRTGIEGLGVSVDRELHLMRDYPTNYAFIRLEDWRWQPEFIRMKQRLSTPEADA